MIPTPLQVVIPTPLLWDLLNTADDNGTVQLDFNEYPPALEATQGQMDCFVRQLSCKCHLKEDASVEDWPKISPQLDSRVT